MTYKVAALYQFVALPDFRDLREKLHAFCAGLGLKGTLLLAPEGVNGTLAGTDEAIDRLCAELQGVEQQGGGLFGGRLDNLELKFSRAQEMPFARLKIRLKKEIVTFKDESADPTSRVGAYVDARDWNALISAPDVIVLDTRNAFEVDMGSFAGAVDPKIARFSDLRDFVDSRLDPKTHPKVAMFCTGGIRCEKASSYMLARGFSEVFHLKGGILKYLEQVPKEQSLWRGECFVFDQREALGHGLVEHGLVEHGLAVHNASSRGDADD